MMICAKAQVNMSQRGDVTQSHLQASGQTKKEPHEKRGSKSF